VTDSTTTSPRRRRRALLAGLAVAGIAVIVAACGSSSSALTGKTWQLTAITEKVPAFQGVVPSAEQTKYTINFATGGTFEAKADCNNVAGSYTTPGSNGLNITVGPSTLAACPAGSLGDVYVVALGNAASFAIASDVLTITLKDGGTLVYTIAPSASSASPAAIASAKPTTAPTTAPTAAPTTAPTTAPTAKPTTAPTTAPSTAPGLGDLTGKVWQLTTITERVPPFQGVVPVADQPKYTINFATDGTFSAIADCNNVAGSYTTTATGGLTIVPGPTTGAACPEGSLGGRYVTALGNAVSYAIATNVLTITLKDGGTLAYTIPK